MTTPKIAHVRAFPSVPAVEPTAMTSAYHWIDDHIATQTA